MLKFRRFTRTMLVILLVYMLALVSALYFVSSALARDATRRLARGEVYRAVESGLSLLAGERDDLNDAVNPAVNPSDVFLLLLDQTGAPLAVTAGAEGDLLPLDRTRLTREISEISAPAGMLLMGAQSDDGAVIAGKTLASSERAAVSFRALMLQYGLIAFALTLLVLFLLAWRIMQPVDTLVNAAERLSEGEVAEVSEKLPVELRPLGRAFNHMSRRLAQSLGDLTNERDTLSQVLEGLDEGVLAVDQDGDLLRENRAAVTLLGGRGSQAYARVLSALRRAGEEGQKDLRFQVGERTLLAVFRPLAAGALAVLRDVTEHERLERTRHEYVANISHELRTPLASMRGLAEGLRDGLVADENERARYYELILAEIRRLSRLVNDLLELGNLQSSPAAFAIERVDAAETLYELYDRTLSLAEKKGVALSLAAEEDLPFVYTNEDRLQQVLTILLDNAIKFTPAGGQVTLGAHREARYVRFSVRDTGIGMDDYTARHAFDRFHQADPSHGAKGSGLGLAIAREIMQRLGLRMLVKSAPGEGSEFSFLVRTEETEKEAEGD